MKRLPTILRSLMPIALLAGLSLLLPPMAGPTRAEAPCPEAAAADLAGDRVSALEAYDLCLEIAALSERQQAETHRARGLVLLAEGKIDCALSDFDQAIWLAPSYALAYVGRGQAYLAKARLAPHAAAPGCGKREQPPAVAGGVIQETKAGGAKVAGQSFPDRASAERWLKQQGQIAALQRQVATLQQQLAAERASPAPPKTLLPGRRPALKSPGEAERGIADFTRALLLDPGLLAAPIGRGEANCALGHPEAALSDWSQLLDLDPNLAEPLQQELTAAGFYKGPVDGRFGPQSDEALAAFAGARCH